MKKIIKAVRTVIPGLIDFNIISPETIFFFTLFSPTTSLNTDLRPMVYEENTFVRDIHFISFFGYIWGPSMAVAEPFVFQLSPVTQRRQEGMVEGRRNYSRLCA